MDTVNSLDIKNVKMGRRLSSDLYSKSEHYENKK